MNQSRSTHTSSSTAFQPNTGNATHANDVNSFSTTGNDYGSIHTSAQNQQNSSQYFSGGSDAFYINQSPSPGLEDDKLDLYSSAVGVAKKDMLGDSIFPTWKDESVDGELEDPSEMQKKDPLAAQIWRLYSKTKKGLPHAERMENLTWRMMAMNLAKRKHEEAARYVQYSSVT